MKFFYLISIFILFLSLLLVEKNDKKLNVLTSIVFCSSAMYFLTCLCAITLTSLNIKNSLFSFSLFNLLLSCTLWALQYKKSRKFKIQKYRLNKKELICFIFLIVGIFVLSLIRFKGFTSINHSISDSPFHYKSAADYLKFGKLYTNDYNNVLYGFNHVMFGFYVPCGLFMEIMPFNNYISYNIFYVFVLTLITLNFYVTCLEIKSGSKNNIFTLLVTILYFLAYPLNYALFGFGYLGPGILATNMIILTWKNILKYNNNFLFYYLFLFNFGLFCSYYLFAPAVYLAEGLFMIFLLFKKKYKFSFLLKWSIICLILPTLFGFFYFVWAGGSVSKTISVYNVEGGLYKNLWGNFVFFIPLLCYSIGLEFKNKKTDFDFFFLLCSLIYIVITLVFVAFGKVSTYYFYKYYYVLWIILYLYVFKLINYKKYHLVLFCNISLIVLFSIVSLFDIGKTIYDKDSSFSLSNVSYEIGNAYNYSFYLWNSKSNISKEDIELMESASKYKKECGLDENFYEIPYDNYYINKKWFYTFTNILPSMNCDLDDSTTIYYGVFDLKKFDESKVHKCFIISNKYKKQNNKKIDYSKYNILFENNAGKLLIKK